MVETIFIIILYVRTIITNSVSCCVNLFLIFAYIRIPSIFFYFFYVLIYSLIMVFASMWFSITIIW